MARDYKYRANPNQKRKKTKQNTTIAWWKWLLVIALIALFIFFLVFLRNSAPELKQEQGKQSISKPLKKSEKPKKAKLKTKSDNKKTRQPRFDFYTVLPETEIVVPDYEINTRSREEKFGKVKKAKYIVQAGSFRNFAEADKLRARLALMGFESRVEKAKIGEVVWNRVKMGPFSLSSSVSNIKKRLKENGIDTIITEKKS